jgi:hypothetical protein
MAAKREARHGWARNPGGAANGRTCSGRGVATPAGSSMYKQSTMGARLSMAAASTACHCSAAAGSGGSPVAPSGTRSSAELPLWLPRNSRPGHPQQRATLCYCRNGPLAPGTIYLVLFWAAELGHLALLGSQE